MFCSVTKIGIDSYSFEYFKVEDNVNSNCLSRLPLNETVNIEKLYELMFVIKSFDEIPVTIADIKKHTDASTSNNCNLLISAISKLDIT